MEFSEAYIIVNNIFSKWKQRGIALAGYTDEEWIFKSHVIEGDITSGISIIVNKTSGEMRLFNVGYPEDREVAYNATMIEATKLEEIFCQQEGVRMVALENYWLSNSEWLHYTDSGEPALNDDAPEEAKKSYKKYLQQLEDIDRRTGRYLVIPKDKAGWNYYDQHDADWNQAENNSYSDEYMTVIKIPYEEFLVLRDNGIDIFIKEASTDGPIGRMSPADVKECIVKTEPYKDLVPVFYSGLIEAEEYGQGIEFVESIII